MGITSKTLSIERAEEITLAAHNAAPPVVVVVRTSRLRPTKLPNGQT